MGNPLSEHEMTLTGSAGSLGFFDQSFKRFHVFDRDVGEDLAVDFDIGLLQTGHQFAVSEIQHAAGRVDADRPQSSVLTLFLLAADVSMGIGFIDRIIYGTDPLAAGTVKTFCSLNCAFTAFSGRDSGCNSHFQ